MESLRLIQDSFENEFDKKLIYELISLIIEEKDLNEYIEIFDINNKNKCEGIYFPKKRELFLNLKLINYDFYMWYHESGFPNNIKVKKRYYNIYLLNVIYHELEHANQNKMSFTDKNESKDIIIKEGIELGNKCPNLTIKEHILYNFYHDYILLEKAAEANSLLNILNIDKSINIMNNEEKNYISTKLIDILLKGYKLKKDKLLSASFNYYKLRGKEKEYQNIPFNEDYSNLDKLTYGMPINNDLYLKLKEKTNISNKMKLLK